VELRNVSRYPTRRAPDVAVLRMDGPLFFAATKRLQDRVADLVASRPELRAVVLDASAITDIDASGAHALHELADDLRIAGVELHLAMVRGPVRDVLERARAWDLQGERIHASLADAVHAVDPSGALWAPADDEEAPDHVL
jgi:sulfate permease, SulP family